MTEMMVRPFSLPDLPHTPPEEDGDARVRVAAFSAGVRAAGREWTGNEPNELVELLTDAAAGDPRLTAMVRAGGRLLQDFLDGYQQKSVVDESLDLAADLVAGRALPPGVLAGLASRHLVAVVRLAAPGHEADALRAAAGPDALVTQQDDLIVLLVPVGGHDNVEPIVTRLTQCLGGRGWLATAERDTRRTAEGFDEACEVLRLVVAGLRPSGAYALADVLVEYAVTRHERVRTDLVAMIRLVREHQVLWETLVEFVNADYSRNKAARNLFIHRSTLDYRLRRIGAITGCDPLSRRGAQLLTTAMTAEAVQGYQASTSQP